MKNLILLLAFCCSFFTLPLQATSFTNFDDNSTPIFYEILLPDYICAEEVVSYQLYEMGEVSNIYEIQLANEETLFQVVSMVFVNAMPYVAEYACLAAVKNPTFCKVVHLAAEALIAIYGDEIYSYISTFWKTTITGNQGFATIDALTLADAHSGQKAFEISHQETNFPWNPPSIEKFSSWGGSFGG